MEPGSPVHFVVVLCPQSYQSPVRMLIGSPLAAVSWTSPSKAESHRRGGTASPQNPAFHHLSFHNASISHLSSLHFPTPSPSLGSHHLPFPMCHAILGFGLLPLLHLEYPTASLFAIHSTPACPSRLRFSLPPSTWSRTPQVG